MREEKGEQPPKVLVMPHLFLFFSTIRERQLNREREKERNEAS